MTVRRVSDCLQLSAEAAEQVSQYLLRVRDEWAGQPLGVGEVAGGLGVLPLLLDMGGFIGLRDDGRLVEVDVGCP